MNKLLITIIAMVFSVSVSAQTSIDIEKTTNVDNANAADSSNDNVNQQGNVNITFEAADDTRGIDSPIQSRGEQVIEYRGEYDVNTVPPVSAPGLATTLSETCMGSTSAGAGWVGFGFSFGTTWRDSACVRRLDARQLSAIGYNLGAKELMCDSDAVREALLRAGKPCFVDLPKEVREYVNAAANAAVIKADSFAVGADGGEGISQGEAAGAGVATAKW